MLSDQASDKMIAEDIPVTKVHGLRAKYRDPNGIEREYVPDFVTLDESMIYEIKGGYDSLTEVKRHAMCMQMPKGCGYVVLAYDEKNDEFVEI